MTTAPQAVLIPDAMTSLQAVQTWVFGSNPVNPQPSEATNLLVNLINQASRMTLSYLNRPTLRQHLVNEVRSGVNGTTLTLREFPIIGDLVSLQIGNVTVPKRPPYGTSAGQSPVSFTTFGGPSGWALIDPWDGYSSGAPQTVAVAGFNFWRGDANIAIQYNAGYAITGEVQTASAGTVYPNAPQGPYCQDQGVTYANGTALTAVPNNPAVGQYVAPSDPTQPYTFNTGETQPVLLSYSYVPSEINYAVTKWVGEFSSYRQRIGQRSRSLGGQETTSYDLSDMPNDVKLALASYRRVMPLV